MFVRLCVSNKFSHFRQKTFTQYVAATRGEIYEISEESPNLIRLWRKAFPAERMSPTAMKLLTSFSDWLEHHSLRRLTGLLVLQYAYSVQSYGSLEPLTASPLFKARAWGVYEILSFFCTVHRHGDDLVETSLGLRRSESVGAQRRLGRRGVELCVFSCMSAPRVTVSNAAPLTC